jgi:hypothetical protein
VADQSVPSRRTQSCRPRAGQPLTIPFPARKSPVDVRVWWSAANFALFTAGSRPPCLMPSTPGAPACLTPAQRRTAQAQHGTPKPRGRPAGQPLPQCPSATGELVDRYAGRDRVALCDPAHECRPLTVADVDAECECVDLVSELLILRPRIGRCDDCRPQTLAKHCLRYRLADSLRCSQPVIQHPADECARGVTATAYSII